MPDPDRPGRPRQLPRPPGGGGLCETCRVPLDRGHSGLRTHQFAERPGLWRDGWVDLRSFGLPADAAEGWPEVREGVVADPVHGGLGLYGFIGGRGPWVRHPVVASTAARVSALAVLRAAGVATAEAVDRAVSVEAGKLDALARPADLRIDTPACGEGHHVEVLEGEAHPRCGRRPKQRYRTDPPLATLRSPGSCTEVADRWRRADAGVVQLDTTAPLDDLHRRVGADPAVAAGLAVMAAAMVARFRLQLIAAGEPDRFLQLSVVPVGTDDPGTLRASTWELPVALIAAPPTWLWSTDPLELIGFSTSPASP